MSRTYKDKPWKLRWPDSAWHYDCERIPYETTRIKYNFDTNQYEDTGETYISYIYLQKAGVKTKKKRNKEEWHWMTTPMWWIREMMNQPQRIKGHRWEKYAVNTPMDEIEDLDPPGVGRKPHIYYW